MAGGVALAANAPQAPALPKEITASLDRSHKGWTIVRSEDTAVPLNVVEGDFDGNGRRDYAVFVVHRPPQAATSAPPVGTVLAFLNTARGYRPVRVTRIDDDPHLERLRIEFVGKGATVYDLDTDKDVTLERDAVAVSPLDSGPCYTFVYRGGAFTSYWTCD